jgi:phage tail sheath protein FI
MIEIGVAPVKPAEFMIIRFGQRTADATNRRGLESGPDSSGIR